MQWSGIKCIDETEQLDKVGIEGSLQLVSEDKYLTLNVRI